MAYRHQFPIEQVRESTLDEIVTFLIDNFTQSEAILASVDSSQQEFFNNDLRMILTDLVRDSTQCTSSGVIRDTTTQEIDGVALACKTAIFEQQLDRLHSYDLKSEGIQVAVEFLKCVFNRLDVTYHLADQGINKPIFIALVCVRRTKWRQGIGKCLLNNAKWQAMNCGYDGLIGLCTHASWSEFLAKSGVRPVLSVRYDSFKGTYRNPPIVVQTQNGLQACYTMLGRLN